MKPNKPQIYAEYLHAMKVKAQMKELEDTKLAEKFEMTVDMVRGATKRVTPRNEDERLIMACKDERIRLKELYRKIGPTMIAIRHRISKKTLQNIVKEFECEKQSAA